MTVGHVDLKAGVVQLDPGTTKNNEGRSFYVTAELRKVLKAQLVAIEALKRKGVICPYIFHRPDGTSILDFRKTWRTEQKAKAIAERKGQLRRFRKAAGG